MSSLLEQVFSEAAKLPPQEQEALARRWLSELAGGEGERKLLTTLVEAAKEPYWPNHKADEAASVLQELLQNGQDSKK